VKYVMDASIAASLFLPDEENTTAQTILGAGEVIVPTLFWYEMANVLWASAKRGRLDEAQAFRTLELLRLLRLSDDSRPIREFFPAIFLIAREHGLTAYDAAYLELAAREGATLCSHDAALRTAASAVGLALLPV
jgi:predicted nucleic acid-binding protein